MASYDDEAGPSQPSQARPGSRGALFADNKLVCHVQSSDVPFRLGHLSIDKFQSIQAFRDLETLPYFTVTVQPEEDLVRIKEWYNFRSFLWRHTRVGVLCNSQYEFLLQCDEKPVKPDDPQYATTRGGYITVFYAPLPAGIPRKSSGSQVRPRESTATTSSVSSPPMNGPGQVHSQYLETVAHAHTAWAFGALAELIDNSRDAYASRLEISIAYGEQPGRPQGSGDSAEKDKQERSGEESLEEEDGEVGAEGRGAGLAVETVPMLCVTDNGCGMTHKDVVQMLSLGHEPPPAELKQRIGRFGVGFKSGSMRLGVDVVVLTQSSESRTIAFLSRTLNHNKPTVEIPIITYRKRKGGGMALDTTVCTPEQEQHGLRVIASITPFDQFRIGEEFHRLEEMASLRHSWGEGADAGSTRGEEDTAPSVEDITEVGLRKSDSLRGGGGLSATGTRIFILGLRKERGQYELDWESESNNILIRSRRRRNRPNQMAKDVPIDWDLREYLKVIFLPPAEKGDVGKKNTLRVGSPMEVFVQGQKAETGVDILGIRGAKCTKIIRYTIIACDKPLYLRLGFSENEKVQGRCGLFLYWRGRLIEAYKKVGDMEHGDKCLGLLGVADTTHVLEETQGGGVVNCKQRFLDTAEYDSLLAAMAVKVNRYRADQLDKEKTKVVDQTKINKPLENPKLWAQCDDCEKWRRLPEGMSPPGPNDKWFCYMKGEKCETPEDVENPDELTTYVNLCEGRSVGTPIPADGMPAVREQLGQNTSEQHKASSGGNTERVGTSAADRARGGSGPSAPQRQEQSKRPASGNVVKSDNGYNSDDAARRKRPRSS